MSGKWLRQMRRVLGLDRTPVSSLRVRPRVEGLEDRWVPATFTVENLNDAGTGSLRQAILDANASAGADDIVFQSGLTGTIALTTGQMEIAESVTITGNGAANTVIDAQQLSRIFDIYAGDLTLAKLTLTRGKETGQYAAGGAVRITSTGTLTVTECALTDNVANYSGGAIYSIDADVTVTDSTLSGNSSPYSLDGDGSGGAIYSLNGDVSVTNSTLTNNTSHSTGGAIYAGLGALTVTNTTLTGNSSTGANAGALFASAGDVSVSGSTLSDNTASMGAAIYALRGALTVTDSTLTNNSATDQGGAIYGGYGATTVTNSTLTGNTSSNQGGAIGIFFGSLTVTNSTLTDNTAANGSGGAIGAYEVTVTDSIVSNNSAASGGGIYSFRGASVTGSTLSGNTATSGSGGAISAAGFDGVVTVTDSTLSDNSATDGGAIAVYDGTLTVTNSTLTNNSTTGGSYGGGAIYAFWDATVTVTDSDLTGNSVTGQNVYGGAIYALAGATVTGSTLSGNTAPSGGGAIYASSGPVTVTDSILNDNSTTDRFSSGGAISTGAGSITITDSTLSRNSADLGGAIATSTSELSVTSSTLSDNSGDKSGGAIYSGAGAVTITNSTLANNSAASGYAGGLFANTGALTVIQSTLTGNAAAIGGAIVTGTGTAVVTQSTISGNSATTQVGGIYSFSSPYTIKNSIVAGNTDDGTAPDVQKSPDADDAFVVEFSLIGNNTGTGLTATGLTPDAGGNLIGDATTPIDPVLAPLADNGGPTQTMALLAGSPALNRGNNPFATDAGLTTDQRGGARVVSGTVDMGAFEAENAAPTDIALSGDTVAENKVVGTVVGTLAGTDAGDTLIFALVSGTGDTDNGLFQIVGNELRTAAVLDFETQSSYSVRVAVTDAGGLTHEEVFTITVTDAADVLAFDVQKGAAQRSYIRYLTLTLDTAAAAQELAQSGRLKMIKYDLNGQNGVEVAFGKVTVKGRTVTIDYGPRGFSRRGNPNVRDGYYTLLIDVDGDTSYETSRSFYRLLGDTNGDGKVTRKDVNAIRTALALGSYGANLDLNSDGTVDADDLTMARRRLGRAITSTLQLDD